MTVKILIVDDEEMIRWTLKEGLECEGYEVKDFKDGRSFLEHFKRFGADIVFLDVRLPDSNGLDLLLEANKLEPEAIIIIMTAYGDVETAVTAMKRGAYDYLPKPYNLVEVNLMVHKIIQANIVKSQLHHFQERFETQFSRIIGENQKMKSLREEISIAAKADKTTVLIRGESGTGKELVARQIHFQSNRADKPFIDVNAAAVSGSLLESELFGHEKGAFTDAQKQKKGLFELANSGTLFLDEIGDLDMSLQVKLLRVLQERKFSRVGGTTDIHVDVRVISATNADLEKNIEEGRLRADLFYRLNIFSIKIPPLRERRSDILLLAKNFLDEFRKEFSKDISGFREDTIKIIENYDFPGNVRELRNIIERATLLESSNLIRPASLPEELKISSNLKESSLIYNDDVPWRSENFSFKEYIDSVEKRIVQEVLKETDNKKSKAAQMLGLTRFALRHQLKKHGIEDDDS
ncbi:MAG: sigma-54 dependent transcriptional regulator [Candidatus Riflebacteria bacterium]